jgi:bacterioferritin-associated ferredoxin
MTKTILCHCEDIEVEELYSALEQGYGDIETLKRFTGIGTGKCQGKCCFVQTLRLLATLDDPSAGDGERPTGGQAFTGDPRDLRVPTLRPPVLPLRIDDIIEKAEEKR